MHHAGQPPIGVVVLCAEYSLVSGFRRRILGTLRVRGARYLATILHRAADVAERVDAGESLEAAAAPQQATLARKRVAREAAAPTPSRRERDDAALVRPPGTPPASWSAATRGTAQEAPAQASDEVCHAAPEENAR